MSLAWSLRQALPSDAPWIAELRADVMRPDLERLGRWDPVRVRQRFRDGFLPAHTFVIEVEGSPAGVIAVRPERDEQWIEHFYLGSQYQGRGLGSEVLRHVMATLRDARPFRLNVLKAVPRNGSTNDTDSFTSMRIRSTFSSSPKQTMKQCRQILKPAKSPA